MTDGVAVFVGVIEDVGVELGVGVGLEEGQRFFSQTYGYVVAHV